MLSHPVHVSVVNIHFEGKSLYITMNTFVDDLETAYFHFHGDTIDMRLENNFMGEWFTSYLENSFHLKLSETGERISLQMDTVKLNELSISLEYHAVLNKKPKSLYIYNSFLTDIFADQVNLLIYSTEGVEKGIKFDYHKRAEELKLR